ncbi:hypothetical protein CAC01_11655 [Streptomyces sp. CLI2509]|nr:hypothetical protein CAC01_11655 [Streptomyces sp. CLI2509]
MPRSGTTACSAPPGPRPEADARAGDSRADSSARCLPGQPPAHLPGPHHPPRLVPPPEIPAEQPHRHHDDNSEHPDKTGPLPWPRAPGRTRRGIRHHSHPSVRSHHVQLVGIRVPHVVPGVRELLPLPLTGLHGQFLVDVRPAVLVCGGGLADGLLRGQGVTVAQPGLVVHALELRRLVTFLVLAESPENSLAPGPARCGPSPRPCRPFRPRAIRAPRRGR